MKVPLEAILTIIRENLNDRYRQGFPIIKELLQNADDVGAGRLDFGLVPGLPEAQHPLLRGGALFVINDGPFSEDDARAINSIGLSRKPADRNAVGKFGLGLKSLFHLCEAFFYVVSGSPGLQFVNPWAETDQSGIDVDRYHPDWNTQTASDYNAVIGQLQPVLGSRQYLCLWFPLRMRQHLQGRAAIMDYYPGDVGAQALDLFSRRQSGALELPGQLAAVMPLLQSLQEISAWELGHGSEPPQRRLHVVVRPSSQRRRPVAALVPGTLQLLSGHIIVDNASMPSINAPFVGFELLLAKPVFSELQASGYWPQSSQMEAATGAHQLVPHAARPHCAVHFVRLTDQAPATLDISRAVFLPVDEPFKPVPMEGSTGYRLVLHGDYFVDAGRSRIEGWVGDQPVETVTDTHTLRESWNRHLAQEGTLPLVLPALDRLARETRMAAAALYSLTEALRRSGLFTSSLYRETVCRWQKWVFCATSDKQSWQLLRADTPVLPIPKPPESAPGRPFEVLPELQHLMHLSFREHPQLASSDDLARWSDDQLLQVLELPIAEVFSSKVKLDYLIQFVAGSGVKVEDSPATVARLQTMARQALVKVGPDSLRAHTGVLTQFIALLPRDARCVLRLSESQRKLDGAGQLLAAVLSANIHGLLVPDEFDPADQPAQGHLGTADCLRVLRALAAAELPRRATEDVEDVRTGLALQMLDRAEKRQEVLAAAHDLPLFRARLITTGGSMPTRLSVAELVALEQRGLLFKFAPPPIQEGLARLLQAALPNSEVSLVQASVAEIMANRLIATCDVSACLNTLARHPDVAGPAERARLLDRLLQGADLQNDVHIMALRYLLHGVQSQAAMRVPLYIDRHDVWSRVATEALALHGEQWRILAVELANQLNAVVRDRLHISEMTRGPVVEILQALDSTELARLTGDALAPGDGEILVREVRDINVLRAMRIHAKFDGGFTILEAGRVFLPGPFQLGAELLVHVTLLSPVRDPVLIARYGEMGVTPLDAVAAIETALRQPNPHVHWRTLLEAVGHLDPPGVLPLPLKNGLTRTAWLPTKSGEPSRPEDVLYLPKLADQIDSLLATAPGQFISVYRLADDLSGHPAFGKLAELTMPVTEDAVSMLGEFMRQSGDFCLGQLDADTLNYDFLNALVDAFGVGAGVSLLPSARVVRDVRMHVSAELALDLLRSLLCPLPSRRLLPMLLFIAQQHGAPGASYGPLIEVFNAYLAVARGEGDFETAILPHIRLLSRRGQWKVSTHLCYKVEGIDDADLVDDKQGDLLRLASAAPLPADTSTAGQAVAPGVTALPRATEHLLDQSAERLKGFFRSWDGAIDRPIVGGFLSLLGDFPKLLKLAKDYLGRRDVAATREMLEWRPLDLEISRGRVGGFGEDAHAAIGYQRYIVDVIEAQAETVRIGSLAGTEFDAHLLSDRSLRHLIVEDGRRLPPELQGGNQVNHLRMRKIDSARFSAEALSGLLRETARIILRSVYYQSVPNLDQFWADELEHTEQLDIDIAQDWVLESAFSYLPQLGLRTDPFFGACLQRWEKARSLAIQAKHTQRLRKGHSGRAAAADVEQQAVQTQLKEVFEQDTADNLGPQKRLVQAVRAKVANEYQYRPQSVLFELFQNADDAAAEIGHMAGGQPEGWQKRVVVGRDRGCMFLAHWGRAVNQVYLRDFNGSDLGYDADLRKMLMLQGSDKPGAPQPLELTGKFGLGFKTVFLLTERPEVMSGRLGFEIVAALYPRRLSPEHFTPLRAKLERLSGSPEAAATGTYFEMCPATEAEKQHASEALAEFRVLAYLMVVFARKVEQCDVMLDGAQVQSVHWKPVPVLKQAGVDIGALTVPQGQLNVTQQSLLLSAKDEKLLLMLGPRGFRSMPEAVPTVWVTVPTQEKHNLGIAVNAAFEVDAGRAQLARASDRNRELVRRLGIWLGDRLMTLHTLASTQWAALLKALDLSADVEPYEFWESLWEVLAGPFAASNASESRELLRELFGAPRLGYARLAEDASVIPTRLWGVYHDLTRLRAIRYVTTGKLDTEQVFSSVCNWPQVGLLAPVGSAVAARTGRALRGLFRGVAEADELSLAQVVRWEVSREALVSPELAERLGSLLTPQFMTTLDHAERDDLSAHLRTLAFKASSNRIQPARLLIIDTDTAAGPDEQDELARAAFAPEELVLSNAYAGPALSFFRVCRERLQAPVDQMATWAFDASISARRVGVLRYLLSGEQAAKLARELRRPDERHRFDRSWFNQADVLSELLGGFTPPERQRLMGLLELEPAPPVVRPISPQRALQRVLAWWRQNQAEQVQLYEQDTYPQGQPLQLRPDAEVLDPKTRHEWLTLFLLGASHTIGRATPQAHRGFLEMCENNGWTAVFADPDAPAERWMAVLDDYLDTQIDEPASYLYWMRQFVSIYQLSRHLDVYREALLNVPRIKRPFQLSEVTNLRTSALYQGSGMSAPPLDRTLGAGACFVMRELVRLKVIASEQSHRHCYVPVRRVRECFVALGCELDEAASTENSQRMHAFLVQHLGPEDATFDGCFDLPFHAITRSGMSLRDFLANL